MIGNEDCSEFTRWAAARGITDLPRSRSLSAARNGACSGSSIRHHCRELGYSLRIGNFPEAGGRGLAASRNLKEGELILRVPKSALMSMLSAKEDPLLAKAVALHPDLSSSQILTVHLLNEVAKGKLSSWHTYLVELPRLHHTLAHFTESAIRALQVEDATWVAQKAVGKSLTDWEASKGLMQQISLRRRFTSLKAWLWASATVSSRTLYVPWDEAGTLCPVGDLFNYAPPGELYFDSKTLNQQLAVDLESAVDNMVLEVDDDSSWNEVTTRERLRDGGYEADFDEYCFYARQDYETGQQVLLCYGQYNNLELLEHYGFSMAQNPNDNVHISLPDCAEFGSSSKHLPINLSRAAYIEVNGSPSFSLLADLRLRAAKPPLRRMKGHIALMGEQISKESDILVYQWLWRKCEQLLVHLLTSLEDDLALMELVNSARCSGSMESMYSSVEERNYENTRALSQQEPGDHNMRRERVMCELEDFLRSCGGLENGTLSFSDKAERWKLALEWRIGYKRILHRSCLLCAKKVGQLTSGHE